MRSTAAAALIALTAARVAGGQTDTTPRVSSQEPKAPFPYSAEEVSFESVSGVRLAGTLTVPRGNGPFPAAVLVSGSGPHDRNGGGGAWKPFLVLADHLARQGIASLRYDKRGHAASTGNYAAATSLDFADDAEAAFRFLRERRGIASSRVGIIGHSEGGMIAPMIAARSSDVAFIVLLAGPGLPGDSLMLIQVAMRATAAGRSPALDPELIENRRLYAALRAARDSSDAAVRLAAVNDDIVSSTVDSLRAPARRRLERKREILLTPFWRYLARYDPRPTLMKVRAPVLALNGTLDVQVPHQLNLPEISAALKAGGNGDVTTLEMPGLNHLFQTAIGIPPSEYGKIDEIFAPAALDAIAKWITARVGQSPGRRY
jgi:pimeloyl-ACP methyl ester carboxylesterase